jgi:3-(3-hydroxy-phenyl)propionate hydroxylase
MNNDNTQVIVLGAGPTGLAAATLLANSGVEVAIVDPFRLPAHHPRATHIDDETMRSFQSLGASHLEPTWHRQAAGNYQFFDAHGQLIQSFPWRTTPTDQGWYGDYQFFQPDFENHLRGRLHASPSTTTWFGWRAQSIGQSADHVEVAVHNERTGADRVLTGKYLIGADGARSLVRTSVADEVEDLHATHRSLILDIVPIAGEPNPSVFTSTRAALPNPVTIVPGAGGMVRFEFLLMDGDATEDFEQPNTWYDLLQPYYDAGSYRIMRADVYRWQSLLPSAWRRGRFFIAGDAAHQMTPHLGQGMCSGIRDAMNLSWKVSARLRGAPDHLLDTYESERKPHVRVYMEAAAGAANAVEHLAASPGPLDDIPSLIEIPFPNPALGHGLHGETRGPAGALSIQPVLRNGSRLDDTIGYNFAVVGDPSVIGGVDSTTKAIWARLDAVVTTDLDSTTRQWLNSFGVHAVVIRPDRYVFDGAKDAAQLDTLSARLDASVGASYSEHAAAAQLADQTAG